MSPKAAAQTGIFYMLLCLAPASALSQDAPAAPSGAPAVAADGHTAGNPPTDAEKEKHRLLTWEKRLSSFAAREHATMMFDVPEHVFAPMTELSKTHGVDSMKAMASTTRRIWRQQEGVQLFTRNGFPLNNHDTEKNLLTWIENMDAAQFNDLVSGKLWLSQLDDASRELVLDYISGKGDLSMALLNNSDGVKITADITPRFTFADATGQSGTVELGVRSRPGGIVGAKEKAPDAPKRVSAPLDAPTPGKLDFGPGKLLTLKEIVARAGAKLGARYDLDERVAANIYFISGSFTESALTSALKYLTAVPATTPHQVHPDIAGDLALLKDRFKASAAGKIDITWLREEMPLTESTQLDALADRYGASESLDTTAFANGGSISASTLSANSPGLAYFLQQNGVGANTTLNLSFGVTVTIGYDGSYTADAGWLNGGWQTSLAASQFSEDLYR